MMKRCFLALLCLSLLLCACAAEPDPSQPTETAPIKVVFTQDRIIFNETQDNIGKGFYLSQTMDVTGYNGVIYAFSPGISTDERIACIRATDAVLSRMNLGRPHKIVVFDTNSYTENYPDGEIYYTHAQSWHSPEYIAGLVLSVCGEYCNYGAAYGYASILAEELFGESMAVWTGSQPFSGDANILDMNYLCFRQPMYTAQEIEAVKEAANTFACSYIRTHSEAAFQTLLIQSGQVGQSDSFHTALSDFLSEWGIIYVPSQILYRPAGCGYRYIAKSACATVLMEADWQDYNSNRIPWYTNGYLRDDYSQIKEYLTTVFGEMVQYRILFGLDGDTDELKVYFSNYHKGGNSGIYDAEKHIITLPYCNSLSLLYIRSLIYDYFPEQNWAYYGLQTHFSWYYDHYGNAEDNYTRNLDVDSKNLRFYQECRKRLGRDLVVEEDFWELSHYYAYYMGHSDPDSGSSDSFVAYLITRFGEQEAIAMLLNHELDESAYRELVSDWNAFIQATYGKTDSQDVTE